MCRPDFKIPSIVGGFKDFKTLEGFTWLLSRNGQEQEDAQLTQTISSHTKQNFIDLDMARRVFFQHLPHVLPATEINSKTWDMNFTCSMACFRTKFISSGSSCSAAIFTALSRRIIWLTNKSLKTPEQLTTTSTLGLPSSFKGMTYTMTCQPHCLSFFSPILKCMCHRILV